MLIFIPISSCFILLLSNRRALSFPVGWIKFYLSIWLFPNPLVLLDGRAGGVNNGRLTLLRRIMFWDLSEVRSCHSATQCFSLHTLRACRDRKEADRTEAPSYILVQDTKLNCIVLNVSRTRNHSAAFTADGQRLTGHTWLQTQQHTLCTTIRSTSPRHADPGSSTRQLF